ncbi:histidine triad (HIT) family protein [Desulfonauticus submarinus]|uniref:Histidine triad (HIT) family protein n=1 Tax=Desulfonauticus submarinus TaxID=206665 RepID=A0A1H0F7E2_9BACT|nr:HIT family protein [Desulfonauticus submarinus]SDN90598.1 histidine triad (HIT) family protein [Desulfonauticus submarinus]
MSECIFCDIIHGKIPCAKVYETKNTLAFLDIAPVNKGHTLVIPKKHYPTLFDLPSELGKELLEVMQKVGEALRKTVQAEGINLGMNNFKPAGQLVFHAHFHIIPRYENDGLSLWPQKKYNNNDEMLALAQKLANNI